MGQPKEVQAAAEDSFEILLPGNILLNRAVIRASGEEDALAVSGGGILTVYLKGGNELSAVSGSGICCRDGQQGTGLILTGETGGYLRAVSTKGKAVSSNGKVEMTSGTVYATGDQTGVYAGYGIYKSGGRLVAEGTGTNAAGMQSEKAAGDKLTGGTVVATGTKYGLKLAGALVAS